MTLVALLHTMQAVALAVMLVALAAAGFFGTMAWMAHVPLHTARRWLRWAIYPAVIWLLAFILVRFLG